MFKCIIKKIRARVPYAGEKKYHPIWGGGKFRKLDAKLFFSLIVEIEGQQDSIIFEAAESSGKENIHFIHRQILVLATMHN